METTGPVSQTAPSLVAAASKRPAWRQLALLALGVALPIMILSVLFVPPPAALVRHIAAANGNWLLGDYLAPGGRHINVARRAGRKLLAAYLQYGMAEAMRRRYPLPAGGSDADRIMNELVALRPYMLDQAELPHPPLQSGALLNGFGYCDQMNAAAAKVLGGGFAHAQIVALADPRSGDAHTIGRVWSRRENGWLYFDLWGRLAVFRLDAGGHPVMLRTRGLYPGAIPQPLLADVAHMYNFAATGQPLSEYPASFGGYLGLRLWRMIRGHTDDSLSATTVVAGGQAAALAMLPRNNPARRREYVQARMALLLGDAAAGRAEMRRIAATNPNDLLGRAAALTLQRLMSAGLSAAKPRVPPTLGRARSAVAPINAE